VEGPRLIERVRLQNFLSFGPEGVDVELQPLNVLVGPNGSGKSNFLRGIDFLRKAPEGADAFRREGESAGDFLYKGINFSDGITLGFCYRTGEKNWRANYSVELSDVPQRGDFVIITERLELIRGDISTLYYTSEVSSPQIRREIIKETSDNQRSVISELQETSQEVRPYNTILSQPSAKLADYSLFTTALERIFFFGSNLYAAVKPSRIESDQSFLFPDGSNLANVVESLQHQPLVMAKIHEFFRHFYPNAVRIVPGLSGGKTALFIEEKGLVRTTPASRLSHGTIQFLCLATALLHPNPPPLICIEQPEDGLHPDVIPSLARMLIDAATRTQVIVTTHSAALVDALREIPESILVCERGPNGTTMERLDPEQIRPWLEEYTLGDLWLSGRIGGTRF
jgi:predicted ATPase